MKEVHPFSQSLYDFNDDDIVFQCLQKYFSKKYLFLSTEERDTLRSRLQQFKQLQKKCLLIKYMMGNLELQTYLNALRAYAYFLQYLKIDRNNNHKMITMEHNYDLTAEEAVKIFILKNLYCINDQILTPGNNLETAFKIAKIVYQTAAQFLNKNEEHYKQVVISLKRSYGLLKSCGKPSTSKLDKDFCDLIIKLE